MIVYMGGRRSGKTTRLLKWWLEDPYNRHIVCSSEQRALLLRHQAAEMIEHPAYGDKMIMIAKLDERVYFDNIVAVNPRGAARWEGIEKQKVAIDDLEEVLGMLFHHRIEASAMNIETVHWMEDNT